MSTFDVGLQLRSARIAAGLTLREVARRAGVSHQLVEKIEKGQNTTIETLESLGGAMRATIIIKVEPRPSAPLTLAQPSPAPDRLAVASRLMAVLPRLPDDVVDELLHDVALWETQHPPKR